MTRMLRSASSVLTVWMPQPPLIHLGVRVQVEWGLKPYAGAKQAELSHCWFAGVVDGLKDGYFHVSYNDGDERWHPLSWVARGKVRAGRNTDAKSQQRGAGAAAGRKARAGGAAGGKARAAGKAAVKAPEAKELSEEEVQAAVRAEGLILVPGSGMSGFWGVRCGSMEKPKPFAAVVKGRSLGAFATTDEAALAVARSPEGKAEAARLGLAAAASAASAAKLAAKDRARGKRAAPQPPAPKRARVHPPASAASSPSSSAASSSAAASSSPSLAPPPAPAPAAAVAGAPAPPAAGTAIVRVSGMEAVKNALERLNLGAYAQAFELDGWDDLGCLALLDAAFVRAVS